MGIQEFNFHTFCEDEIYDIIQSLDTKKACGFDHLPAKILKMGNKVISAQLTSIINSCINNSTFPDMLKLAQITPLFKKRYELLKNNYRPVSILPAMSKIVEKCINSQLVRHAELIFSPMLFCEPLSCDIFNYADDNAVVIMICRLLNVT